LSLAALAIGQPIEVSAEADDLAIEKSRLELETRLNQLQARAAELLQEGREGS
jgi:hypothetical protein